MDRFNASISRKMVYEVRINNIFKRAAFTVMKTFKLRRGQAFCVSSALLIFQVCGLYYSLDSSRVVCILMFVSLSMIQFPVFLLVLSTFLLPREGVVTSFAVFFFSTYYCKFYAISLAYSILAYHVLTGHRWFWRKYVLYLFLNIVFLMLTRLCFDFPSKKHLLFVPIEIAFSLWTYFLLIRKYERNLQVDDGCKTNL